MTDSPFKKIIFPALLAAGSVFAALTLPLSSLNQPSWSTRLPGPVQEWFSPLLHSEHKKLSIRYVGFSITTSVIAGFGTAELMRLRQKHRQRQRDLLQLLLVAPTPASPTETRLESELIITQESTEVFAAPTLANWMDGIDQAALPGWNSPALWDQRATPQSPWPVPLPVQPLPHTCRIQLPGSSQRVLAIQVDGDYYSFFRLRKTEAQALSLVATLEERGQIAIATPHAKGHAVWIKQPHATVNTPAWEQWPMAA